MSLKKVVLLFAAVGFTIMGLGHADCSTNSTSPSFQDVMNLCNISFITPMEYLKAFNNTGVLPDEYDTTGMCYLKCVYEKSNMINNWTLNPELIRQNMWPATGDSIPVCEKKGNTITNGCIRLYRIVKCLITRALVDARSKNGISLLYVRND